MTSHPVSESQPRLSRKTISRAFSLIVALALIAFLITVIDWQTFGDLLFSLSPLSIIAGFLIYVALNFFRSLRFKVLLDRDNTPIKTLFPIALYHNFLVRLLPFKLGELSYIVLLKNRLGVKVEEGISSLAGSRLLELLVIVMVAAVTLLIAGDIFPEQQIIMMVLAAVFVLASMAAFYYAGRIIRFGLWMLRRIIGKFFKTPPAFLDSIAEKLESTAQEFDRVSQPRLFLWAFFWSFFTYSCSFAVNLVILYAVGVRVTPVEMVILISMGMFATAFPFNISGFGVVEFSWGFGLTLLAGFSLDDATAIGLLNNGFQIACAAVSGLIGYAVVRMQARPIPESESA